MTETPAQREGQRAQQVLPLIEYLARVARRAYDTCLAPGCLRPRHLIALSVLNEHGPLSQQALGEALSLDPSNVVGLLNELEQRLLITRERDPADRRRHIVSLSGAGASELAASDAQFARMEDEVLVALSAAERAQLRDLLGRAAGGTVMPPGHGPCEEPPCEAAPEGGTADPC
jgi:DNA-binding MarR family transcriptional regulator